MVHNAAGGTVHDGAPTGVLSGVLRTDLFRTVTYPLAFFVLVLLMWHYGIRLFEVPRYILPAPGDVWSRFRETGDTIWMHTAITLIEATAGFALAVVVGLVFGALIAQSRLLSLTIYPYLVALYTVPIIAVAPLLIIWFGFGMLPKIVVAGLISFFPIVINTIRGLHSADFRALQLMESIAANEWTVFRKIRVHTALPYIFSSFKIAVPVAVVGAVVGEFLGSDRGLGALIIRASSRLQTDLLFVSIVMLGALGIGLFLIVTLAEKIFLSWYDGTTTL